VFVKLCCVVLCCVVLCCGVRCIICIYEVVFTKVGGCVGKQLIPQDSPRYCYICCIAERLQRGERRCVGVQRKDYLIFVRAYLEAKQRKEQAKGITNHLINGVGVLHSVLNPHFGLCR
jgi:hypothetical protein